MSTIALTPVGRVESSLTDRSSAPKQGFEGGHEAWLVFEERYADAVFGLEPGQRIIVLTWLDKGDRATLQVHPRSDPSNPIQGVFNTRSPDRPNPIGMHPVEILAVEGVRVLVSDLEAIDGTPIVDVKPVLSGEIDER